MIYESAIKLSNFDSKHTYNYLNHLSAAAMPIGVVGGFNCEENFTTVSRSLPSPSTTPPVGI
uniref:Uncharacterized protein n=1 Tax=Glossina palpalis gambiensis TaxID=67801 RepID=A0A1B0C4K3_9MUSC